MNFYVLLFGNYIMFIVLFYVIFYFWYVVGVGMFFNILGEDFVINVYKKWNFLGFVEVSGFVSVLGIVKCYIEVFKCIYLFYFSKDLDF